ncbi:MAG: PIN domain-containing protein [Bryobacterales bacterium]|nr:PIN domain-containing protein [Bryobacterales bacterium]
MLVLDANILIRAVLGVRVHSLLQRYVSRIGFFAPDTDFAEARSSLPAILERRQLPVEPGLGLLDLLPELVQPVGLATYRSFEHVARLRIAHRDEDDWPISATAMALNCAIWTEDTDFFGCGVATWTSDQVELYLSQAATSRQ